MARRSSARLRAKQSATPQAQRVSDMGIETIKTPLTAPRLSALNEQDESQPTPVRSAHTPRDGTPIKPSPEEMHPQKYQMSTAKPLDEARWLGFSSNKATQQTPTKTPKPAQNIMDNAPNFNFTFRRPSLHLSPQARALMDEKKEEAAKIRSEMQATQKDQPSASDVLGRKMATPAGKVSRFSDVHMKAFKKMDSIADHPSSFRHKDAKAPATDKPSTLKRSPSKAELERPSSSSSSTSLPRPSSRGNLDAGPAKRVKRAADDDATTSRPQATPKAETKSSLKPQTTPRTAKPPPALKSALKSAKSARRTTMIPSFQRSPVKMGMTSANIQQQQDQQKANDQPPPQLLSKSPIKSPVKASVAERIAHFEAEAPSSPLLSRSPAKPASPIKPTVAPESPDAASKIPFLARSPAKMTSNGHQDGDTKDGNKDKASKTPLLSRSPAKIAVPEDPFNPSQQQTPAKPSLMTRFNLLRQSPVKSILRTPQRLYSNDPLKLASGTHLSTPPNAASDAEKVVPPRPPKTAPVIKHVDFSASTKGLENNDSTPDTPTKASSPPHKANEQTSVIYPTLPVTTDDADQTKKADRRMTMAGAPGDFTFRAGAQAISFAPSPRRATSQGMKSSIRSVDASPELPTTAGKKRKLSSDAVENKATTGTITSDKENDDAEQRPAKKARSEKSEPSRPSATPAALKTPVKKVPTVGVRPKSLTQKPKEKRPGMLSQARLAMLATPKRR